MSGVDTSIYANYLRPGKSAMEFMADNDQLKQSRIAGLMNQAKLDEYKRGVDGEKAEADAYRSAVGADGKTDRNKLFSGLAQSGHGAKISAKQKGYAEQDEAQRKAEMAAIKNEVEKLAVVQQFISPTQNQAEYDAGMQQATSILGPAAVANIPKNFDAQRIANGSKQIMSMKEQWELRYKELEAADKVRTHNLNVDKFGEQKRSNLAQEAETRRGHNLTAGNAAARLAFDKSKPQDGAAKPMPATALKMQQADLEAVGIASGIQADLGEIEKQIGAGKLDFGPISNLVNKGRNMAGMSNESSRNMASFKSSLEKLRNDSLRLNTGVQTDGDAQRAWNELFENINDKGVVTQRLAEIKKLNARAVNLRKLNIDNIRSNYGRESLDTTQYENQGPAIGAGAAKPSLDDIFK